MEYLNKDRWVGYLIFSLATFLAFCLIFESYIILPVAIAWTGRLHPLLVHFPIVLLLAVVIFGIWKKKAPKMLVGLAAILALITGITGFFLGSEATETGRLLIYHKWLGGGLALASAIWYGLYDLKLKNRIMSVSLHLLLLLLIGTTGHYGGMVTHGEDYLAFPVAGKYENIPENPLLYKDIVRRILKDNCMSCHNDNKRKGDFAMNSMDGLLRGGESGNTLLPGDPENSEMIRRLRLATGEEDHMPPEGRRQLESFEIGILERWIALGASDTLRLNQLGRTEPLYTMVHDLMAPDPMDKWKNLPVLADSTLERLSSDYLTIRRIAGNSDALSINVYRSQGYNPHVVTALAQIASNIVELDLSGLPLGSKELDLVASCRNLEWLELDGTPISDGDLVKLDGLPQLRFLKLYETQIGDKGITSLNHLDKLEEIYLWKTSITSEGLAWLKRKYPELSVNSGIDRDTEARFKAADSITLPKDDISP